MAKFSRYNFSVANPDGGFILFNSLTKNIILMTAEDDEWIKTVDLTTTDERNERFSTLLNLNFIVDDDFDELEYYKLEWNRSLYASGILRHTIILNLACNCDCPYCFENKNGQYMTMSTAQTYLEWLEPQVKDIKYFYMTWFGGEPLLSKKMIEFITDGILKLAEKYHFEYSACIVTNGVLADEKFVSNCEHLHIANLQITIDGEREIHNRYRFLKMDHGKTFDTILSNFTNFCTNIHSDTASILRINLTDENYTSIPKLLDEVPEAVKNNCVLLFRWVYSHNEGRSPGVEFSTNKKGSTPYENLAPLYKLAASKGFTTNSFDEGLSCNFCECDFDHALQVNYNGDLFMCTHSMDKSEIIGNIYDGFGTQRNLSRYARFINVNPFNDQECFNCKILPLCKGGCRKARYLGRKVCSDVKYSLESYIIEKAQKAFIDNDN
jgi:radical SAM domain protein